MWVCLSAVTCVDSDRRQNTSPTCQKIAIDDVPLMDGARADERHTSGQSTRKASSRAGGGGQWQSGDQITLGAKARTTF